MPQDTPDPGQGSAPPGAAGALRGLTAFTDPATLEHDPQAEIWVGARTPAVEVAQRVTAILAALREAGATIRTGATDDVPELDRLLAAVHAPELLSFLAAAAQRWATGGYAESVGQDRVVPYVFPTAAMLDPLPLRLPTATHALSGVYCYDTMTLLGPGTWPAARAAADLARRAAQHVADAVRANGSGRRGGPGSGAVAYALCRPPGHHATRAGYGGSCYLNNAAVAATTLRDNGFERVAVLDVDAHHGNGTQAIFYHRQDVGYASVHVDPGAGWFPHYAGFADETGTGAGRGTTHNVPLPPGSGDEAFLDGVAGLVAAARRWGAQALVISLGVDAAGGDPESPLQVTPHGFTATGQLLAGAGLPTVLVQEGGYDLTGLGDLVTRVLAPFAEAVDGTGRAAG